MKWHHWVMNWQKRQYVNRSYPSGCLARGVSDYLFSIDFLISLSFLLRQAKQHIIQILNYFNQKCFQFASLLNCGLVCTLHLFCLFVDNKYTILTGYIFVCKCRRAIPCRVLKYIFVTKDIG